jgi:two-component system, sensor histidine kinase
MAGPCVLVVEDNPDGAEALRVLLSLCGLRPELARDGPEGVRRALELRPAAAVVDIGLPGYDGFEVARRVRAALGPSVRLVAHTAWAGPDARRRAREAGFDAFLGKPADPAELFALLGA